LAAVGNVETVTPSNGQTECQINQLTTLKWPIDGRAGVDLLRSRAIPLRVIPSHTN
jgi:transposase